MRKTQLTLFLSALLLVLASSTYMMTDNKVRVVKIGRGKTAIIIEDEHGSRHHAKK